MDSRKLVHFNPTDTVSVYSNKRRAETQKSSLKYSSNIFRTFWLSTLTTARTILTQYLQPCDHNGKKNEYGVPNHNVNKIFTTKCHELYISYSGTTSRYDRTIQERFNSHQTVSIFQLFLYTIYLTQQHVFYLGVNLRSLFKPQYNFTQFL